ncbi:MAG TPA: electron transfer flavoprotein subunit beta/FixA family protein [Gammaproteobacteria bacterium]|nr:electron transfer flavoprotein subunit beta/FixA family protein [Gammaproteobacteria bacterium]
MKVIVAVKRVPEFKATLSIKADGSAIDNTNTRMLMNPFDEIAIEEAIRLKEKGYVQEVVAVTIGRIEAQDILRTALAMGADRAILVLANSDNSPLQTAKILKAVIDKENPNLVMLGKQAIDTDNNQTGQMLAGLLNWSQAVFVSKLEKLDAKIEATREIDGGLETLLLQLPAVITTDLRLNEPRYISLPNIMNAKRKPIENITIDELGINPTTRLKILGYEIPQKKRANLRLDNVAELVKKLKEEAKIF